MMGDTSPDGPVFDISVSPSVPLSPAYLFATGVRVLDIASKLNGRIAPVRGGDARNPLTHDALDPLHGFVRLGADGALDFNLLRNNLSAPDKNHKYLRSARDTFRT